MKKYWDLFTEAYQKRENIRLDWEEMNRIDVYMQIFIKTIELSEEQKQVCEYLVKKWIKQKEPMEDFQRFLPFLFPVEQLEKALFCHQQGVQEMNKQNRQSTSNRLMMCIKANALSEPTKVFLETGSNVRERLIMVLGMSYLINQRPNWLSKNERQAILWLYRTSFNSQRFLLKQEWFVVEDAGVLEDYRRIMTVMETQDLLRAAVTIACQNQKEYDGLPAFVKDCKAIYEELRFILVELKQEMEREEHAYA